MRTGSKPGQDHVELPNEALFQTVDEQTLREARERRVAQIRLLWGKRRLLLQVTLTGLVLAIAIAFIIPKRYRSTARLMPPDQDSGQGAAMLAALTGRAGGSLSSLAQSALGVATTGDLFVGVLGSNTVRDDIINKFDLQKVYRDRFIEDARKSLTKHTDISEDSKSNIIAVSVTDRDPKRAAQIAQEYINELNWVMTHLGTSAARRERIFLDQRLTQVKANLENDERQFSEFASNKGAVDIPEQGKAMVTAAATLQGQLIATESELESLRQIYTDNNVRVRSMQARVDDLRNSLRKIGGQGADENTPAEQLYPSLRELPLLGVDYADLLRRTKVQEAVFEALTQEDELAKVQEAREIPSVKILDAPEVPQEKSFPSRPLIISLGTCLALVAAIAWVLLHSRWEAIDINDPRRLIVTEMWDEIRASLPRVSGNGSSGDRARSKK